MYVMDCCHLSLCIVQVKARKQDGVHSKDWVNAGSLTGMLYKPEQTGITFILLFCYRFICDGLPSFQLTKEQHTLTNFAIGQYVETFPL